MRLPLPASLEVRGFVLIVLAAASIALPGFVAYWLLSSQQERTTGRAAEALLAVALDSYLDAAAGVSLERNDWLDRLAEQEARLRWAGAFDEAGGGLEFRRRTNLRKEEVIAQIPFDAREPTVQALEVNGQPSRRFMLLTVPQPSDGGTLAAVIDLGANPLGNTPLAIAGLVCLAAIGIAAAFAWFHFAILNPVRSLTRRVSELRDGLASVAIEDLPDEFRDLARSVNEAQRELKKWRVEAGQLRYSLDVELDARTRKISRQLNLAQHQATTDPLSRLQNRRALEDVLPALVADHAERGRELTVVVIDIDHFKKLNDRLGHQAGDEVIEFVGQLLRSAVRDSTDVAARIGGDEFVLVLPGAAITEGADVVRRVRELFLQRARLLDADPKPGMSAGVVSLRSQPGASAEDLLALADKAMYLAKHKQTGIVVAGARDSAVEGTSQGPDRRT